MNLAVIPAKGTSLRLPRKNIRPFHGLPIIQYSIEAAQDSELFEHVVVSTDDDEIAQAALDLGAGLVWRDNSMTIDSVGTQEVTADAIRRTPREFEYACCIYATAPLMSVGDLSRGYWTLEKYKGTRYAFSVGTDPLRDAAQFYWGHSMAFLLNEPLIAPHTAMVPIESKRVCDINTLEDFELSQKMFLALHA